MRQKPFLAMPQMRLLTETIAKARTGSRPRPAEEFRKRLLQGGADLRPMGWARKPWSSVGWPGAGSFIRAST